MRTAALACWGLIALWGSFGFPLDVHACARFVSTQAQYLESTELPVADYPFVICYKFRNVAPTPLNQFHLSSGDASVNDKMFRVYPGDFGGTLYWQRFANPAIDWTFVGLNLHYFYADTARRSAIEWHSVIIVCPNSSSS